MLCLNLKTDDRKLSTLADVSFGDWLFGCDPK